MVPVTVVVGLPGAGKSTWIEHALATRPAGARWAVLGQDGPSGGTGSAGLLRQPLGPGCACCALRPALGQALTRVLRAGPWDRLILEADGASHPERLVAVLREPPYAAALRVEAIVLVVDGRFAQVWLAPASDPSGPAGERRQALIGAASAVVVNRPGPDADALAARLAEAPPFGRTVRIDDGADDRTRSAAVRLPPPAPLLARWPATPVFDRRALRAVLTDWSARHPALPARGAWPTARAWYAWQRAPGMPEQWDVSAYCLEARLDVGLEAGLDPGTPPPAPHDARAYAELVTALDRLRDPSVPAATGPGTDDAEA